MDAGILASFSDMPKPDLTHPSDEALERFLLDQLQENEISWVEEHILVCGHCLDRVQVLEKEAGELKLALREFASQESKKRRFHIEPRYALLAAAMIVLMIAVPLFVKRSAHIAELNLVALRGSQGARAALSGQPVRLHLDCKDLADSQVDVQVVDNAGTEVWNGLAEVKAERATVEISRVPKSGQYWVRLFSRANGNSRLLREYGFVSEP